MIDLDIFNGNDLQNFAAFLSIFESEGINDIRFVRTHIYNHLHDKRFQSKRAVIKSRIDDRKRIKEKKIIKGKPCPNCGNMMVPAIVDGADNVSAILGCKNCRYSEIVK